MRMAFVGLSLALTVGCTSSQAIRRRDSVRAGAPNPSPPVVTFTRLPPHTPLSSPQDIVQLVEKSPVLYRIAELEAGGVAKDKLAPTLWAQVEPELRIPTVQVDAKGVPTVTPYPADAQADALLREAAPFYERRDYPRARALYERALQKSPRYYPAMLALGDVLYSAGDYREALQRYRHAIPLNPYDYRGHSSAANALLELGRGDEALDDYAWALALRPQDAGLQKSIGERASRLGIRFEAAGLVPLAFSRPSNSATVDVYTESRPHWLAYGLCKGIWVGEKDHRLARTGNAEHRFSNVEESECLTGLLVLYAVRRGEGETAKEAGLDALIDVARTGGLDEWILFNIASRVAPHVVLRTDDDERQLLHDFILKFVLVDAQTRGGPGVAQSLDGT